MRSDKLMFICNPDVIVIVSNKKKRRKKEKNYSQSVHMSDMYSQSVEISELIMDRRPLYRYSRRAIGAFQFVELLIIIFMLNYSMYLVELLV